MSMDMIWLSRKPRNKLDRFALEYLRWRGLIPQDYRGAPWIDDPDKQVFTGPQLPVWLSLRSAWANTSCWRPRP